MKELPAEIQEKLTSQQNIWIASVRADGRPHLTPVWFAWYEGMVYICIDPNSVKASNLAANPNVVAALEDGSKPVICEATARQITIDGQSGIQAEFFRKYEWDITTEKQYNQLIEITPVKWLFW